MSDKKTMTDTLDFEKVEAQKLRAEKEDLLKRFQEADSATHELQDEINKKEVELGKLGTEVK